MMTTRRTKITIETERRLVIKVSRSRQGQCAVCGDEVCMLTIEQAAALSLVDSRTVCLWVKLGMIHLADSDAGEPLICAASLRENVQYDNDA